ncbi:phage-related baseplate assembly protein [Agrobacterium sp. RC10-4-1]|uniref:baseplate J/gp47 family protein n=1 Tax=Agrobacterium sp. RC10-4-1 TaxID=2587039 RepID=UPI0017CD6291|nr:baseplate J/gp47 family protein [Agrobacterium sp. RC10-4-1]MBA8798266.1 phage-related baseplate assembly protein [Agrobacterium sp. RC10-4-1]
MAIYVPTTIDVSRLPVPDAIEPLDFETLYSQFKSRFLTFWNAQRAINPSLPEYDVQDLETDPAGVVGEAWSYLRLLDRQRVNDAFRSLLAAYAKGSDLDAVVADQKVFRLIVVPATANAAAIMEGDDALLRRYFLSFDVPSAASAGRYLFDAWTAWPQSADKALGLWDARVNGRAVHGRRGDTDVVIIGPMGRLPTVLELDTVRSSVTNPNRAPESVAISVMAAGRTEYAVSLVLEIPAVGPSADIVRQEAEKRVTAAATSRILIGGEIPEALFSGAAFGDGVIRVRDLSPVVIQPDAYKVPVMTSLNIAVEVRA